MGIDALVLAGGEFREGEHAGKKKALVEIKGSPLCKYVMRALGESSYVNSITIVGPQELCYSQYSIIPEIEGGSMGDNLQAGLIALQNHSRILQLTCDLPFITSEAIDHFIKEAEAEEAELVLPIVSKEDYETRFPGTKRTWGKMKEGRYKTGNIFYYDPKVILANFDVINSLLGRRKNVVAMARLLGPLFLCEYALGLASITGLEKQVSNKLGCKAKAIYSHHPELAFDIDKPSDFEYIQAFLL